jgi:hypothetical protein
MNCTKITHKTLTPHIEDSTRKHKELYSQANVIVMSDDKNENIETYELAHTLCSLRILTKEEQ